jgi:hypothetical protein
MTKRGHTPTVHLPPIIEWRTSDLRKMAEGLRNRTLVIAAAEIEKAEDVDLDAAWLEASEPLRRKLLASLDAEIAQRKIPPRRR